MSFTCLSLVVERVYRAILKSYFRAWFTHVEGIDHVAELVESVLRVIVAREELFFGFIHGEYFFGGWDV